jgi:mRNA interferase MazF
MDFNRWDVVTALFPFVEIAARKPRPVLVLSNLDFNRLHEQFIAAMITTGKTTVWPSDTAISDLNTAGLSHPSVVATIFSD